MANEAFARVEIDQLLKDTAWSLTGGRRAHFERPLDLPIDSRIAGGGERLHQTTYIDVARPEMVARRHKLLAKMASHRP